MPAYKKTIQAKDYDAFRDAIPSSGVFDMTDCAVKIWCPEKSDTKEIERMVNLLESMVHVTDVQVGSRIQDFAAEDYSVEITETATPLRKKYPR